MDIEIEKKKFIELLRLSYKAEKSNNANLIIGDASFKNLRINEQTLSKYGFGDQVFWKIICPALKDEGYLESYSYIGQLERSWIFGSYLYDNSTYVGLTEKLRQLEVELPSEYSFRKSVSGNNTIRLLDYFSISEAEKVRILKIEKNITMTKLEIKSIEKNEKNNYPHEFVVNEKKLLEDTTASDIKNNIFVFSLSKNGILSRKYALGDNKPYSMEVGKLRHSIILELIESHHKNNHDYYNTEELANFLKVEAGDIRKAVEGIRKQLKKSFKDLRREDFIEGKKNRGYKLNNQIRI